MEERLLLLSLLWILLIRRRRRHQRIRRNRIYWVHPLLENKSQSQFRTDYPKLRRFKKKFYKKFRMNKNTFDYLLNELNSELQKKDTAMRKSIPSVERLAMTLRQKGRALSVSWRLSKRVRWRGGGGAPCGCGSGWRCACAGRASPRLRAGGVARARTLECRRGRGRERARAAPQAKHAGIA